MNVMSMEDRSEGKHKSRRYLLALRTMIGLNVVTLAIIGMNPTAADGALLQAYSLGVGAILGAYFTSGYSDRKLATAMQRDSEQE